MGKTALCRFCGRSADTTVGHGLDYSDYVIDPVCWDCLLRMRNKHFLVRAILILIFALVLAIIGVVNAIAP